MSGLNEKHKLVIDFYLADPTRNRIAAYRSVYGNECSDKTARANCGKIINHDYAHEYIRSKEIEQCEKVGATPEWVVEKLHRFSEAKITNYYKIKKGVLELKDLKTLPPEMVDCIQEIQQTKDGIKIKLVDKKSSVEMIGKKLGLFEESKPGDVTNNNTQFNIILNGPARF